MFLVALTALAFAAPAVAQKSPVEGFLEKYKFMNRYRPKPVTLPEPGDGYNSLEKFISGTNLQLGVGDVVELALRNNLDIKVNRLTPYSTGMLVDAAYRPFEPTARFTTSIMHNERPSSSQLTGLAPVSEWQGTFTAGITQVLPSGTQLAGDASMIRSSTNNPFISFNPSWTGLIRLSVTQPLLRDYGRNVNMRQIRIARNNESISELQFERQVIDLVAQSEKAYWDLVFAAEDLKVKQQSLDLANKTLDENRKQVTIGTLAPIDVVQAEREVAQRNLEYVAAGGTLLLTEDQIKRLISNKPDPGMTLAKITPMDPAHGPVPDDVAGVERAIKVALESRPELRELDFQLRNRDIDLDYQRNQMLPSVNAFATYNVNGLGGVQTLTDGAFPPTIIGVNRGGVFDALGQLFSFGYPGFSVGVNVEIPLRNRSRQAEYSRAFTERRITEDRKAALQQQIALEVRNAITTVETNRARIEAAQKTRELAQLTLEAEQKKFTLGASVNRFVLEEQRNLRLAQTSEILAQVNYAKSIVDYERAIGQTLRKRNIDIDETLTLTPPKTTPATDPAKK
jgi:outer membrane protein TolC